MALSTPTHLIIFEMAPKTIHDLPEEILDNIVQHVQWRSLHGLRQVSKAFARVAGPHLYRHLYMSAHAPDIDVFTKVANNIRTANSVREIIWDDTTYLPSTEAKVASKLKRQLYEKLDPDEPKVRAYELWNESMRKHKQIREEATDHQLLKNLLPHFPHLQRITLTDIDAEHVPTVALSEASPTVRLWHKWLLEDLDVPPAVSWHLTDRLVNQLGLMSCMATDYEHELPPVNRRKRVPFRGLVILLRTLSEIPNSVDEFVIKPLRYNKSGSPGSFDSGISHMFFRYWHDDLARMESLFSRLTKLQLVVANASQPKVAKISIEQGHLTRVLSGAKLLEHLHLEAMEMGCIVTMLGKDTTLGSLRHASFGGDVDYFELGRFVSRHRGTLSTLSLHNCSFFLREMPVSVEVGALKYAPLQWRSTKLHGRRDIRPGSIDAFWSTEEMLDVPPSLIGHGQR
jgi:hypothetical protein